MAVVGAHLTGEPLNWQLTGRGGRLLETTRTAPEYRFFALADTAPPKPGLARDPACAGTGIEVEIWAVPEDAFGGFVDGVPPPLGIGNVRLADGRWVKGFICEGAGLIGATEITSLGGSRMASWRSSRANSNWSARAAARRWSSTPIWAASCRIASPIGETDPSWQMPTAS